ncbi:MAG: hypothetical protein HN403_04850 [Rhodospirillales bacterium]|jgi:hypothetical protein|nr:hypothetical protein [Rhodospirillales bacterium]
MTRLFILVACVGALAACQSVKTDPEFQAFLDHQGGKITSLNSDILNIKVSPKQLGVIPACSTDHVDFSFTQIPVIKKVEGFTSRMSGYEPAKGSKEVERFVTGVSYAATVAHITKNNEAKGRIIETLAKWADDGQSNLLKR